MNKLINKALYAHEEVAGLKGKKMKVYDTMDLPKGKN